MTREQSLLTRTLRVGSAGDDVRAAKRTVARYLGGNRLKTLVSRPLAVQRRFGPFFAVDVVRARRKAGFDSRPVFGPTFLAYLADKGAPDALAVHLFNQYRDAQTPPKPRYVEPKQGFGSLDQSLWELFSAGRHMGLTDLGTFNPASRLPSGRPSDHAVYPARAFDLGFSPATGNKHPVASEFFKLCVGRPEVQYVILGSRIWSHQSGIYSYTGGGHEGHVHVSGRR